MRNQNKRAMELISKKSNRKLGIKQCLQKVPQSRPRVKVKVTCLNITFVKVKVTHVNNTQVKVLKYVISDLIFRMFLFLLLQKENLI